LTVTLHYLAILLVAKYVPDIVSASSLIEVRQETEQSLEIMKRIGKSSLVSQIARCCIEQLLSNGATTIYTANISRLSGHRSIQGLSNELLNQFGKDDFDELDQSFLDIYSRLPLCE
ncbi:hypothetical protein DPV78_003684, partial [Talaromyces pinophilus]